MRAWVLLLLRNNGIREADLFAFHLLGPFWAAWVTPSDGVYREVAVLWNEEKGGPEKVEWLLRKSPR